MFSSYLLLYYYYYLLFIIIILLLLFIIIFIIYLLYLLLYIIIYLCSLAIIAPELFVMLDITGRIEPKLGQNTVFCFTLILSIGNILNTNYQKSPTTPSYFRCRSSNLL